MELEGCRQCPALIFAIDTVTDDVELSRLIGGGDRRHAVHVVASPGEAMRLIHRHDPRLLVVHVTRLHFEQAAEMIDVLHRRRPQIPLLAITAHHEENIERAVRSAGANHYFAQDCPADQLLLRRTLESLGFFAPVPSNDAGARSPPRSRGAPRQGALER